MSGFYVLSARMWNMLGISFFECEFATQCWNQLSCSSNMCDTDDAFDWLLQFLSSSSEEDIITIATGLWGIWYARNMRVWENKLLSPALTIEWSRKQIIDCREARRKQQTSQNNAAGSGRGTLLGWTTPALGEFKLNVDASIKKEKSFFSIGMVICDCRGMFVRGRIMKCAGTISVPEAVTLGVREALSWLLTLPSMNLT